MKLVKQPDNLEFKWQDVIFKIKSVATSGDKFELDVLYDLDTKGEVRVSRRDIYLTLIKLFVVSWSGVTDDEGKDVQFSMDHLFALPPSEDQDVVILLGGFIWKNTDINKSIEKKTNDDSKK